MSTGKDLKNGKINKAFLFSEAVLLTRRSAATEFLNGLMADITSVIS